MKHEWSLLRSGEKNLFEFEFLSNCPFDNFIAFNLRPSVVNFNNIIAEDNFESFKFTILLGEEEELDVVQWELEFLVGIIEKLLIILLDQNDATCLILKLVNF